MLPDHWHFTTDVEDFLTRAGAFLRSRPALHTTPLTDIEKLRLPGAGDSVFGRLETEGEVRAVCYLTPRGRLGLTPLAGDDANTLAARLSARVALKRVARIIEAEDLGPRADKGLRLPSRRNH